MKYLERLAEWYLGRRGRVVLPKPFFGLAIGGNATAIRQDDGSYWVDIPFPRPLLIALNYAYIDARLPEERAAITTLTQAESSTQ